MVFRGTKHSTKQVLWQYNPNKNASQRQKKKLQNNLNVMGWKKELNQYRNKFLKKILMILAISNNFKKMYGEYQFFLVMLNQLLIPNQR